MTAPTDLLQTSDDLTRQRIEINLSYMELSSRAFPDNDCYEKSRPMRCEQNRAGLRLKTAGSPFVKNHTNRVCQPPLRQRAMQHLTKTPLTSFNLIRGD